MSPKRTLWWLSYLVNMCISTIAAVEITDFVATNVLPDGEVETRIYYKGVSAKETSVARGSSTEGLKFRQLTDGRHFIQLIYDGVDSVRDCEYIRDKSQVSEFLGEFKQDLRDLLGSSDVSVESLDNKTLPAGVAAWFDYGALRDLCRERHRQLKRALAHSRSAGGNGTAIESERSQRSRRALLFPGTIWCGASDASEKYTDLGTRQRMDKCCRKHDKCKRIIPGLSSKFGYVNMAPFTISHCRCDLRHKRDLSDLLRVPETKWCGKGYSATRFQDLGGLSKTDKCCRIHDKSCPFWIGAFESKYGLFNWRVSTLMHCACDERFRTCLKLVGTSDSNLVGKIFFDIVQTKCFVIKKKRICMKKSWWGKCLRKKTIKKAILRNNPKFK